MLDVIAQADAIKNKIEELPTATIAEGRIWFNAQRKELVVCVSYNPKTDSYIASMYCFGVTEILDLSDDWLAELEVKMHNERVKLWQDTYHIKLPPLQSAMLKKG